MYRKYFHFYSTFTSKWAAQKQSRPHTFSSILPICINTYGQYTTPTCMYMSKMCIQNITNIFAGCWILCDIRENNCTPNITMFTVDCCYIKTAIFFTCLNILQHVIVACIHALHFIKRKKKEEDEMFQFHHIHTEVFKLVALKLVIDIFHHDNQDFYFLMNSVFFLDWTCW